jgi:acyl-CoA thioester hydrolase
MQHSSPSAALAGFPVIISWPVQWGDQDAFGHVNNAVFIRWFESGRVAYLERLGLGGSLSGKGIGPILAAINCNYRRPINYPDTVHIGTRVTKVGKSSMTIAHAIFSERLQSIAADGDSVVVMFNYDTQKSSRVPDDLRALIASLEGRKL